MGMQKTEIEFFQKNFCVVTRIYFSRIIYQLKTKI
jgi:hypothetical protein